MKKTIQKNNRIKDYEKRLEEIAQIKFGSLSDDEILHALAERKELILMQEHEQERLEQTEKEAEEKALKEKKEAEEKARKAEEASKARVRHEKKRLIRQKIEELNQLITPDKNDEELFAFVQKRRDMEEEILALDKLDAESGIESEELSSEAQEENIPQSAEEPVIQSQEEENGENVSQGKREDALVDEPEEKKSLLEESEGIEAMKKSEVIDIPSALAQKTDDEFGGESIGGAGIEQNSEFARYVDQLNNNTGSLGEFLQQLPIGAKQNKAFMLKVAEIDPAYAMHYADLQTLKIDEDFNVRIASLDNPRNSGNALAEMLPSARTSKVILTAVKRDFRNVKFIEPQMQDYDEIMTIAKKSALQKIKELKDSADIDLLLPKILQQDKQFMTEVKEVVKTNKE